MPREPYAYTVEDWMRLNDSLEADRDAIAFLEEERLKLKAMAARAQELVTRRAALEAEKQTVTKELQAILEQGRTVATFLRAGLKQSLGERNEKLTQFGIRPFRGRSRRKAAADPSS